MGGLGKPSGKDLPIPVRRTAKNMKEENSEFAGDLGFRVFKLDSTNIQEWEPKRDDLAAVC